MTLSPAEFMRRFLLHVLPSGFYRIRHYGLLANAGRRENLVRVRKLLAANSTRDPVKPAEDAAAIGSIWPTFVCRCCGMPMIVVETLVRGASIRAPPGRQGVP
jgi:Putative transposase